MCACVCTFLPASLKLHAREHPQLQRPTHPRGPLGPDLVVSYARMGGRWLATPTMVVSASWRRTRAGWLAEPSQHTRSSISNAWMCTHTAMTRMRGHAGSCMMRTRTHSQKCTKGQSSPVVQHLPCLHACTHACVLTPQCTSSRTRAAVTRASTHFAEVWVVKSSDVCCSPSVRSLLPSCTHQAGAAAAEVCVCVRVQRACAH